MEDNTRAAAETRRHRRHKKRSSSNTDGQEQGERLQQQLDPNAGLAETTPEATREDNENAIATSLPPDSVFAIRSPLPEPDDHLNPPVAAVGQNPTVNQQASEEEAAAERQGSGTAAEEHENHRHRRHHRVPRATAYGEHDVGGANDDTKDRAVPKHNRDDHDRGDDDTGAARANLREGSEDDVDDDDERDANVAFPPPAANSAAGKGGHSSSADRYSRHYRGGGRYDAAAFDDADAAAAAREGSGGDPTAERVLYGEDGTAIPVSEVLVARRREAYGDGAPTRATALTRLLQLQRTFEGNMRKLYAYCSTHVLEWPSLAVEWIPDRRFEDPERDYTLQYLATGTQASPRQQNYVHIVETAVPLPENSEAMYMLYGDDDDEDDAALNTDSDNREGSVETGIDGEEVDAGKRFKNVRGHFKRDQSILVDAPVLKIRAFPYDTNVIAVKTASGFVGMYNLSNQSKEQRGDVTVPDALLRGHKTGGFGLAWNPVKKGYISSGSDDGYVNYWDIKHRITGTCSEILDQDAPNHGPDLSDVENQPIQRLAGHTNIVTDVSWHNSQGHLLASSGMDGMVCLWDIRTDHASTVMHVAHAGGATAAQFHPVGAFQLATAGVDGNISLWDIRRPDNSLVDLAYHGRAVTGIQWAPFSEQILGSFSEDGRVVAWDVGKTSLPLMYSADGVAPPEVAFVHIGHVGRVSDLSWCPGSNDDWLMASTDTSNGLHVYLPKQEVVEDYRVDLMMKA